MREREALKGPGGHNVLSLCQSINSELPAPRMFLPSS